MKDYNCIVVLGPTASGKTRLACHLAHHLNGEIISADSRQVYRHLNIGTGKDFEEYRIEGKQIPYHLIDIAEPTEQFYLHQFIEHLRAVFENITARKKLPVICGGTGLYLDVLRRDFLFTQVKENEALRRELEPLPKETLLARLKELPAELVKHVDIHSKKRLIRGIEVANYRMQNNLLANNPLPYNPFYIGICATVQERRKKIAERLYNRLQQGLVEEAKQLLEMGVSNERFETLGLEYKFVSLYLQHKISYKELSEQLQTAIFQFAKRQMTWFRRMEREGVKINWVNNQDEVAGILSRFYS